MFFWVTEHKYEVSSRYFGWNIVYLVKKPNFVIFIYFAVFKNLSKYAFLQTSNTKLKYIKFPNPFLFFCLLEFYGYKAPRGSSC